MTEFKDTCQCGWMNRICFFNNNNHNNNKILLHPYWTVKCNVLKLKHLKYNI